MLKSWSRQAPTMLVGLLLVGALFAGQSAFADHEPANKFAAAGSDIDEVSDAEPILQERMKISSPFDLVLSASAECSILTLLQTGDEGSPTAPQSSDTASAYGSVRLWVEIDGNRVPVSTDDLNVDDSPGDEDQGTEADASDIGEVTFCNRAYQRTVTDRENGLDGQDMEQDFIRTRTANAFNWLALDVGFLYDEDYNGNNIVDIALMADYDTTTAGDAIARAFVGTRTLIAEPTNASVHEAVEPAAGPDDDPTPAP